MCLRSSTIQILRFSLSNPQSTNSLFSAVLKTNVPGQEFELTISAALPSHLAAATRPTVIWGAITMTSSMSNRNPLTIPMRKSARR